jgi:hypothetical protein
MNRQLRRVFAAPAHIRSWHDPDDLAGATTSVRNLGVSCRGGRVRGTRSRRLSLTQIGSQLCSASSFDRWDAVSASRQCPGALIATPRRLSPPATLAYWCRIVVGQRYIPSKPALRICSRLARAKSSRVLVPQDGHFSESLVDRLPIKSLGLRKTPPTLSHTAATYSQVGQLIRMGCSPWHHGQMTFRYQIGCESFTR